MHGKFTEKYLNCSNVANFNAQHLVIIQQIHKTSLYSNIKYACEDILDLHRHALSSLNCNLTLKRDEENFTTDAFKFQEESLSQQHKLFRQI